MPFRLQLDPHSGVPIYEQIVAAMKLQIAYGRLAIGEQLPSVRALANDLKINPRTVFKAYEELTGLGLIEMQPGRGAFVREPDKSKASSRRRALVDLARQLLADASAMGASPEEVLEIVKSVAQEMERGS